MDSLANKLICLAIITFTSGFILITIQVVMVVSLKLWGII